MCSYFVHRIKLCLFIAFLILFPFSLSANEKKVKYLFLGNHNIPPMIYIENSKPVGIVVDLTNALAVRSGINIEIQALDWAKAQSKVFNGDADALLQINQTRERKEIYDFSDKLLESNFCIFRKNKRVDIQSINSLFGSTVGVEEKGYPKLLLQKYPQVKVRIIDSWKSGFELINAGEIDAIIVNRWVGEYELTINDTEGITVIDEPIESNYSAIAVKKGNKQLLVKINEGLEKIREDGSMEKILKKWSSTETIYLTIKQFNYLLFSIAIAILALLLLSIIIFYVKQIRKMNLQLKQEIEERKQTEGALRESEVKHRDLFNSMTEGVCQHEIVYDDSGKAVNYRIVGANPAYESILNMKFEDVVGRLATDAYRIDEAPYLEVYANVAETGKPVLFETHFPPMKKHFQISVFSPEKGKFATVFKDITELKRLEDQLQRSQKLESIGTLAGGIAHDFNNILSPIMIHTEMVIMELQPESPLRQNMKQIYKAGERARDLVKQILTFARKREKERIPLKVSQISKETIKLLRSTTPTTIDIQYDINSEQDTVLADPAQLNQIIMNLCTNAAHAMEENGGTLEINLTNENLDSESANEFHDLEPGRYVKLSFRDTGYGIEPQIIDKIFEPYFTTKEVGKGTGMGLALVHGIVKSYGGAITVQSEAGKGTSFHVYFPLVQGDAEIPETAKDAVPLPRGTERILFVDDEKAGVDAIQPMLEVLGYKVTARTSSIEALEAFRNDPQGFDLVITDMTMPNMTGKDLAKELMSIRSDIPVILCTGFSEKIDEHKAKAMGISTFLMKPIIMHDMANTIREVLDNKAGCP